MPADNAPTFMIEDARIIYRNFKGAEGQYNKAGQRNFCVILPESVAEQMTLDGWNIKRQNPNDETEVGAPFVHVSVEFDKYPARIVMITSKARTNIGEDMVEVLDWADIRVADLICRGNDWNVNGKHGIKAYLKTLFVTIEEDALERKYGVNGVSGVPNEDADKEFA